MLATLLFWLSVAVALLALIDLLLSTDQKNRLDTASVKLWSILDEAKGWSFADWLKEPRATRWLAVSLGIVGGIPIGLGTAEWFEEIGAVAWFEKWGLGHTPVLVSLIGAALVFVTFGFVSTARDVFKQVLNSKTGEFIARRHIEIAVGSLIGIAAWALILRLNVITMINPSPLRTIVDFGITSVGGVCIMALFSLL